MDKNKYIKKDICRGRLYCYIITYLKHAIKILPNYHFQIIIVRLIQIELNEKILLDNHTF